MSPTYKSIHDPRYRLFVEQLAKDRKISGVSQKDLAQLLQLSQPDVSKIETFERRLDIIEAIDWLSALSETPLKRFIEILESINVKKN